MKHIGKVVGYIILTVNILFSGIYLLSAYSPYINPVAHPIESCMGLAFPIFLFINIFFLIFWLFIKWKYAFVSLLTLLLTIGQIRSYIPLNFRTKTPPENSVKLLSYNVMGFNQFKKHTPENPNPIIEYIQQSEADIVCMQEFSFQESKAFITKKAIDKALKAYPYKNYHEIGKGESSNGLACYSKFPILSAKSIEYESSYNGSMVYELNINGDTVLLINNHLESNKLTMADKKVYVEMIKEPEAKKVSSGAKLLISKLAEATSLRAKQAKNIAELIATSKHSSILVCGDFNDVTISYTHRMISENLKDAFTQSGFGLGISYNQNKFYFRIDNILHSKNFKSYNCTVDKGIKDSDHYPIWCYLSQKSITP